MLLVNWVPFRYGTKSKGSQAMARHSSCFVSYLRLVSEDYRDPYLMGLVVRSCGACNLTNLAWISSASVARVICPVKFCSARKSSDKSASFRKFMGFNSS